LIEGYETPFGMELLSSVHWVATHDPNAASADGAVRAVHAWNERKKKLMKPEQIHAAWSHLKERGWLTKALPEARVGRRTRVRKPSWLNLNQAFFGLPHAVWHKTSSR